MILLSSVAFDSSLFASFGTFLFDGVLHGVLSLLTFFVCQADLQAFKAILCLSNLFHPPSAHELILYYSLSIGLIDATFLLMWR